jgi:predicted nuclease of predicted toxin-antitoxin system
VSQRRFLADENFPLPRVRLLRTAGYDVASIVEDAPGTADVAIMARAVAEGRILLTFDRDYGEIAYRLQQPTPSGISGTEAGRAW